MAPDLAKLVVSGFYPSNGGAESVSQKKDYVNLLTGVETINNKMGYYSGFYPKTGFI